MLRRVVSLTIPLAVVLLMLPGCPSGHTLDYEKTVSMEPADTKFYTIDAPRSQQKIRVQVDSAEPVDVDVTLETDKADVEKALQAQKRPDAAKLLASKQGAKSESVEAMIPAGKSFTIVLSGAKKKTEVKLKVKSI